MSESKHTKSKLAAEYDDNGFYYIYPTEAPGPSPYIVATGGESTADEANAARIVQCWNEYDQLKALNRELVEALLRILNEANEWDSPTYNIIKELAELAIAKYNSTNHEK